MIIFKNMEHNYYEELFLDTISFINVYSILAIHNDTYILTPLLDYLHEKNKYTIFKM